MEKDKSLCEDREYLNLKWKRPEVLEGFTLSLPTPCGHFYLTLNEDGGRLREIRCEIGKSGNCQRVLFQTIAILISVLLQSNIPREKIVKTLLNQLEANCGNITHHKGEKYYSCVDYLVKRVIEDMVSREGIEL